MIPLLKINNLRKNFGGILAVKDLSFSVNENEIVGLIGPNGAGKTTVINLISGIYNPSGGSIVYNNKDITKTEPHKVVNLGIARTFQHSEVYSQSTILENMFVACQQASGLGFWEMIFTTKKSKVKEKLIRNKALNILEFIGLHDLKDELAGNLPYGKQRYLAIGIALATEPKLILLDEPAAGLNSQESLELIKLIEQIRQKNISVILIEHDMDVVMGVCERIVVMNYGEKLAEGTPAEAKNNDLVIKAYLGYEEAM
ncbi:MAG: ABC transporter ATP-binding protein [Bacillota bacterium]